MSTRIVSAGIARSGSTLLASIIGASPDVASIGELFYFNSVVPKGADIVSKDLDAHSLKSHLRAFNEKWWLVERKFDTRAIYDSLADGFPVSYLDVYNAVLDAQADQDGTSHVLEKTISNIKWFDSLDVEGNRLVVTVRNPKAVYASWKASNTNVVNLSCFIREWKTVGWYVINSKSNENVMSIRYEDVVQSESREVAKLFDFLGLDFQQEYLESRASVSAVKEQLHHRPVDIPISGDRVNAWKSELCGFEKRIIDRELGVLMKGLGYDCAEREKPFDRIIFQLSRVCFPFKKSLRKIKQVQKGRKARARLSD